MKNLKFIIIVIFSFLFTNSCRKSENINSSETPINDIETVTASVVGIVVNENDVPVQGATVNLGTNTVTTDVYGMFRFNSKAISKNNTHIKVVKSGYFNGNRSMLATAGRTHNVRIKLIPKTITGNFEATTGGSVSLSTGGKVTIPANAIVDATGNAYSGTVNVAMAWINPTANDLASTIQGDLRGVTTQGYERVLETYGMLGVELTTPTGQELKIATGKTAELTTPIPTALQATAPSTIPLWHFDETNGRWIEEGSANKVGNNYVGSVKHFSFWNYDIALQTVNLCVNVVNSNNQALNNVTVRLRRVNNPASVSYGNTDSLGNVCGVVPMNEAMVLEILDRCGNVVFTQNIGPYSTNANLNVVASIPTLSTATITGNVVNCNNTPVTNGMVYLYTSNGYYYICPINANGSFSIVILNCMGNTINYSITPIDNTNQQQGASVSGTISTGVLAIGSIQACGINSSQYVNLLLDGVPFNFTPPIDSILSYTMLWPNTQNPYQQLIKALRYTNANELIYFAVQHNGQMVNHSLLHGFYLSLPNYGVFSDSATQTVFAPVNCTELGQEHIGFYSGNFTRIVTFPGIGNKTLVCNFRVRRN